jgi:crotonobetainyl-CoA:carnitine CoA-transferase CaiB-like acyl-CoA transferase
VYVHAGTQPLFERLASILNRPELVEDPRFSSMAARMQHIDEAEAIVSEWTADRTASEVEEILAGAGIPCGVVADMARAAQNPQLLSREMLVPVEHPTLGRLVVPGIPIKLSATPGEVKLAPPVVGQDNSDVYCGLLGVTQEELQEFKQERII